MKVGVIGFLIGILLILFSEKENFFKKKKLNPKTNREFEKLETKQNGINQHPTFNLITSIFSKSLFKIIFIWSLLLWFFFYS